MARYPVDEFQMGCKVDHLKDRTIQQCLHCKKPDCNYCPEGEVEEVIPGVNPGYLWSREEIQKATDMYNSGMSCREIAPKIGRSRDAVIRKLKLLGVF